MLTVTNTVKLLPPQTLVQDIEEPVMVGNTNNDLLLYALDLRRAFCILRAQLDGVRVWMDSASGDYGTDAIHPDKQPAVEGR